jgi:hypothetical protein
MTPKKTRTQEDEFKAVHRALHKALNKYYSERRRLIARWEIVGAGRRLWDNIETLKKKFEDMRLEVIYGADARRKAAGRAAGKRSQGVGEDPQGT